jgi:hypothetical protein
MPNDEPAVHETVAEQEEAYDASTLAHDPVEEDDWPEEGVELPRRPRRRLLTPVPIALAAVLLTACGFIGGVLVEKGQGTSSSSTGAASGLAARFAGLRGTGAGTGTSAAGASAGGASAGGFAGGAGGAGGATTGQVAFIQGSTLYVTNTQGNTVKVNTSPASTVTKTVSSSVKAIHPGETVVIVGAAGAGGTVSAESIRVGGGGGLGSLFGGSSGSAGGTGASSGGTGAGGGGTGSGGPALFGSGG